MQLWIVFAVIRSVALINVQENDRFFINRGGDFIIGGLFPIHLRGDNENECGEFQAMPSYHYLKAMLYAIDQINNNSTILPNITLGVRIYDTCHSQTIGAQVTKEFIKMTLSPAKTGSQLVGVIGPQSSDLCKVIADFLRVFQIPQISYGATASVLSDKTIYSYFFRTVPPDTWQAKAMVDILTELNWSYVITINSFGIYGEKGIENFIETAKERGICIAQRHSLAAFPSKQQLDKVVAQLNKEELARVIVVFASQEDAVAILEGLARFPSSKKFYWVASDAWGAQANIIKGLETWAEGAITLTALNVPVKGFNEYFKKLNITNERNNIWLRSFWESYFQCSLENCSSKSCCEKENLNDSDIHFAPVHTVVNAVYAMAHALHQFVKERCPEGSGVCEEVKAMKRGKLIGYLKNTTFQDKGTGETLSFDVNQETRGDYSIFNFQKSANGASYSYQQVGEWKGPETAGGSGKLYLNTLQLLWPGNGSAPPASLCSKSCSRGYVRKKKDNHDLLCCWTCSKCGARDRIVNNTCEDCGYSYVPDDNLAKCMKLTVLDVIQESSSKTFIAFSVIGFFCVLVVAVLFFKHSEDPLIKASSRELSGIILFGLALLFTCPILLLVKPNNAVCISQPFVLGLALASCYAPLFMKILRIYRIFSGARRSAVKPVLVSPASQVLIALGLIFVQFFFSGISFFPTPPAPVERELAGGKYIFLECSTEKTVFASLLSYNMLLMAFCTVVAFKTRSFPRNFNEAKYIGFTMYFTCFVWIIFFPSYLSSANGLRRVNWECGAVLFIGWITLLGLFSPKVYLLFFGGPISVTDQLAVTNNSQAAVVQRSHSGLQIGENQSKIAGAENVAVTQRISPAIQATQA